MSGQPENFVAATREGLILNLFNRIGTAEGILAGDSFNTYGVLLGKRNEALDLLSEIIKAVDGKRTLGLR